MINSVGLLSQTPNESEIYAVINSDIIVNDSIFLEGQGIKVQFIYHRVLDKWNNLIFVPREQRRDRVRNKCFSLFDEDLRPYFSKEDISYMKLQANKNKIKKWKRDFKHARTFKNIKGMNITAKGYWLLSIPLFSRDKKTLIIYREWGGINGSGGYEIYQKNNFGRYTFVLSKDYWIV